MSLLWEFRLLPYNLTFHWRRNLGFHWQENGLLMLHAKPYYYALSWFMRDHLSGDYEKAPSELKETVEEIIKTAE